MVCRKQISKYSHCSILFHFDTVYQKNYRIAIIKSEHRWHGCYLRGWRGYGTDAIPSYSNHSVLMLSTGFCVATRHDCATTVAMTTAETPTKLSGKSHQWSGVCSAKLCSHCILSHQPTGAATANDTTSGTA